MYYLTSGDLFFIGLLFLLGALFLDFISEKQRWQKSLHDFLFCLGFLAVLCSSAPLFPGFYFAFGIVIIAYLVAISKFPQSVKMRKKTRWLAIGVCIFLITIEIPYYLMPKRMLKEKKIYILGDSLTAGIGDKNILTYVEILCRNSNIAIYDLSSAGSNIKDGLTMVKKITNLQTAILVELGGNDWRMGSDGKAFAKDLELLLQTICSTKRPVVMFELPFPPFSYRFLYAQRNLAAKYKVKLIPKRFLASLIFTSENTVDGIHFSQKGHNAMATRLQKVLWE